ncbi:PKD domain, partial [Trinorchestia longiramus]
SNLVSAVRSKMIFLKVVEPVYEVTGFADFEPVLVKHRTLYKVQFWFGTDVSFDWDFGDGRTAVTSVRQVHHTYMTPAEYQLSVVLSNPVSSARVQTAVFAVNGTGACYTPKVNEIYPAGER